MFLLKRKAEVVLLMTTFGMLLTSVHIQPAQALVCYDCTDIINRCTTAVSEKTKKITCPSDWPFCADIEIQEDGATNFVRGCATHKNVADYSFASCDKFTDVPGEDAKIKACFCQTDLCNGELGKKKPKSSSTSRIRILHQLLLFCILVSVSAFWN